MYWIDWNDILAKQLQKTWNLIHLWCSVVALAQTRHLHLSRKSWLRFASVASKSSEKQASRFILWPAVFRFFVSPSCLHCVTVQLDYLWCWTLLLSRILRIFLFLRSSHPTRRCAQDTTKTSTVGPALEQHHWTGLFCPTYPRLLLSVLVTFSFQPRHH